MQATNTNKKQKEKILKNIETLIHNLTDLEVEIQSKSIFCLPMMMHLTECSCKDMIDTINNYIIINS